MKIGGGGSDNANILFSDNVTLRNEDAVVADDHSFFFGGGLSQDASNYSHGQVFNPSGSGIVTFIDGFVFEAQTGSVIIIGFYDTELTTDAGAFINKRNAGAAGASHFRTQLSTSRLGTYWYGTALAALAPWIQPLIYPVELAAGEGFIMAMNTVNADAYLTFTIREYTA